MSGSDDVTITFTDLRGNVCVGSRAPTDVFRSRLSGAISGNELHATFDWARCGSVALDWLVGAHVVYVFDAASGTLWDGYAIFHRR
ncbi:MAG TPA: hypothetical protein VFK38_04520 [Candidatus Limnocylindrales bacterium]|nr:hypothetical protein [Candidatus Limnocylindrales bacterium]